MFESLLGHFNSFCVSVELGGRPLHKSQISEIQGSVQQFPWESQEKKKEHKDCLVESADRPVKSGVFHAQGLG